MHTVQRAEQAVTDALRHTLRAPRRSKSTGKIMAAREAFGRGKADWHGRNVNKGLPKHYFFGNLTEAHRLGSAQLVGELERAGGFAQHEVGLYQGRLGL